MTAPSQIGLTRAMHPLASDPAISGALSALAPAEAFLVDADENPDEQLRGCVDTWGEAPQLFVGVPRSAGRDAVLETIWTLRLLGAGWPDPSETTGSLLAARLCLLRAAARVLSTIDGADPSEAIREDLLSFLFRLSRDQAVAPALEALCLAGAVEGAEREQVLAQIARVSPQVADRAADLLDEAGRLPLTPEEAFDAEGWLLGPECR